MYVRESGMSRDHLQRIDELSSYTKKSAEKVSQLERDISIVKYESSGLNLLPPSTAGRDDFIVTTPTDNPDTCPSMSLQSFRFVNDAEFKKKLDGLVGEELDRFIENMFFVFSRLENEMIGPITIKEVAFGFFSYVFSTMKHSDLVIGNHSDPLAWTKFIGSSLSTGAMYTDAVLSIVRGPAKMSEKINDFKLLTMKERLKILVPMFIVVTASLYSPMFDAFNVNDCTMKLVDGDITHPSAIHRTIGIICSMGNWGAESVLPILLGVRILSEIKSDLSEIMSANKSSDEAKHNAAERFVKLVAIYNESITLNNDPDNLILDVSNLDISIFKTLLTELNSDPYFLEDVIAIAHGMKMQSSPIITRIMGLLKMISRFLLAAGAAQGLSMVMELLSIIDNLGASGKVNCLGLPQKLKTADIDLTIQYMKQLSCMFQGITFMGNITSLLKSFNFIPYAISHTIKSARRDQQVRQGATCVTEALTTNGLKRLWRTTMDPLMCAGATLGIAGASCYTWVVSDAIGGVETLATAVRCPNVTVPGVDADQVNSEYYLILTYSAVILLFLLSLGGAPYAWQNMFRRLRPTKKGPKAITLTKHLHNQETKHEAWQNMFRRLPQTQKDVKALTFTKRLHNRKTANAARGTSMRMKSVSSVKAGTSKVPTQQPLKKDEIFHGRRHFSGTALNIAPRQKKPFVFYADRKKNETRHLETAGYSEISLAEPDSNLDTEIKDIKCKRKETSFTDSGAGEMEPLILSIATKPH